MYESGFQTFLLYQGYQLFYNNNNNNNNRLSINDPEFTEDKAQNIIAECHNLGFNIWQFLQIFSRFWKPQVKENCVRSP